MKHVPSQHARPLFFTAILGIIFISSARHCAAFPSNWPPEYLDSLTETSKATTQAQISKDLIAVLPGEENLTWNADNSRVLMETWSDNKYYGPVKKPGDTVTVSMAHLIWVSSPLELKQWIAEHAFAESDLALRIKQMLGMPPDANKTQFVEFWVTPADLVRPSPDPEINDHEASLDFPLSPVSAISDTYKTWFNNLRSVSYTSNDAHPWTRLGYTYDWGTTYNHAAISEFVIWDGAHVEVASITETANYVTISPTVLDLGVDTVSAGGHLVFNACIPAFSGQLIDLYIVLTTPWGETMSLLRNGRVVRGLHPYYSYVANPLDRSCATLLDYTVTGATPTGMWTATIAVLPAGARPVPWNVLASDSETVMIE